MSALARRKSGPDPRTVRRLAVVRALYLGDMLLAVPALRALRRRFPDAEITLIALPWAESFSRRFACYVDRFVPFAGYPGIAEVEVDEGRVQTFLREQRARRYDLVVQLHGSGRASTPLALALGGHTTAGYFEHEWPAGLTYGAPYPDAGPEVLRNLGVAQLLGCTDLSPSLEFPLTREDEGEADDLLCGLGGSGPLVGLHTGARAPSRRWPAARFARVADALAERGARIVLTGDASEVGTVRAVAADMRARSLVVAGRTTLGGLAALIARMDLFITNDTGPAHLAEAVGTRSLRLIGPADPARWASLDCTQHPYVRVEVGCNPCPYTECPIDHRCLRRIGVEEVLAAATRLMEGDALFAVNGRRTGVWGRQQIAQRSTRRRRRPQVAPIATTLIRWANDARDAVKASNGSSKRAPAVQGRDGTLPHALEEEGGAACGG